MHVMKETVASGNRASGGGNMIKKGVANFWKVSDLYVPSSFLIFFVSSMA